MIVGFTLSQVGMVRHWSAGRSRGWMTRAVINGVGAVLTTAITIIELVSKFTEGAWLIVLVIPALVLLFARIHRTYVCGIEAEDKYHQLVVLIPEVQPKRFWYALLFNQRG